MEYMGSLYIGIHLFICLSTLFLASFDSSDNEKMDGAFIMIKTFTSFNSLYSNKICGVSSMSRILPYYNSLSYSTLIRGTEKDILYLCEKSQEV